MSFQFLGIPPKGEPRTIHDCLHIRSVLFPISRDPPEGGTLDWYATPGGVGYVFPISRDPPEGGTCPPTRQSTHFSGFQFLGIPPKGELNMDWRIVSHRKGYMFPISRDPPEGGTTVVVVAPIQVLCVSNF